MRRSLFVATALAAATMLAAPFPPALAQQDSIKVQSPTMADQFQPHVNDLSGSVWQPYIGERVRLDPHDVTKDFPTGTTLNLVGANVGENKRQDNGVLVTLSQGARYIDGEFAYYFYNIHAEQVGDGPFYDSGNTTTAQIQVIYPDGSEDIIEFTATVFPSFAQVNAVTYPDTVVAAGESTYTFPTFNSTRLLGTRYILTQEDKQALRHHGWVVKVNANSGAVTVTAPDRPSAVEVPVRVLYPYGDPQTVMAAFSVDPETVPEPNPTTKPRAFGSSSS